MTEVWDGTITADDPSASIEDVQLWSNYPYARNLFPRDAKLHYLSLVHVPSIPLYLAVGPSLEVSSENGATSRWLSGALLGHGDNNGDSDMVSSSRWSDDGEQSDCGILLSVDSEKQEQNGEQYITELLLYAAINPGIVNLPTPPPSSPVPHEGITVESLDAKPLNIRVYALPLSSRIFDRIESAKGLATPPEDPTTPGEAIFLPRNQCQTYGRGAYPKRQSLSSLFEDATQKRRKLKGRGGESISKAMADIDRPSSQYGLSPSLEHDSSEKPPQNVEVARRSLSRASSTASMKSETLRPASRLGPLANGKRSSLHRVESAVSPRDSPVPSDGDGGYGQQNKVALTKVIMAGMRLHGLQQRKRPSKVSIIEDRPYNTTLISDATPLEAEDEYKLVYHQTFKAAMFALRRHFNTQAISQYVMRDIVDRFLNLFCSDPLLGGEPDDVGVTAFGVSSQKSVSAFDEPSAGVLSVPGSIWSPPTVKRR